MNQSPEFIEQIQKLMQVKDMEVFIHELEKILALLITESGEEYLWDIRRIISPIKYGEISLKIKRYGGKVVQMGNTVEVTKKY